jgi:hypothetical protein
MFIDIFGSEFTQRKPSLIKGLSESVNSFKGVMR